MQHLFLVFGALCHMVGAASSPHSLEKVVTFALKIDGTSPGSVTEAIRSSLRSTLATQIGSLPDHVFIVKTSQGSVIFDLEVMATAAEANSINAAVTQLERPAVMSTFVTAFANAATLSGLTGQISTKPSLRNAVAKCGSASLGGAQASWSVTASTLRMKLTLDKAVWLAVGFQNSMIGNNVILGQMSGATGSVRHVDVTSWAPNLVDRTGIISGSSFTRLNGNSELTFSIPLGGPVAPSGMMNMVLAHGSKDAFSMHQKKWKLKLDLSACASAAVTSSSDTDAWKAIHGVLMFLAWCVCVPCAILSAMCLRRIEKTIFGKPLWLAVHLTLNSLAAVLTIVGVIIALVNRKEGTLSFDTASDSTSYIAAVHSLLGKFMLAFVVFQVIFGYARPHREDLLITQKPLRRAWELGHKNFGRILFSMAILQVIFGIIAMRM